MSQVQKSSPWICPFFAGFWRFFLWLFLASVEFCGSTGIALALSKSMRRSRHFVECFRQSVTQESSRRQELAENAQQHMKKSVACHCASEGLKRFSRSIDTTATKTELSSPYTPSPSRPPPPRLTHSPPILLPWSRNIVACVTNPTVEPSCCMQAWSTLSAVQSDKNRF